MMSALWMWAIILWIEGLQPRKAWYLAGSGVLMAASALTKYFGAVLILLLAAYSLARLRRLGNWMWFLLIPVAALAGDVLMRPQAAIPVEHFDGSHIPFPDQSWEVIVFVDVLHHTGQTLSLLKEAARVGRAVVIKDLDEGVASNRTLRCMDYVGNARHGAALPYDYWPRSKWRSAFRELGLAPVLWQDRLGLYPVPLTFWFDRSLHFVTRLEVSHSENT